MKQVALRVSQGSTCIFLTESQGKDIHSFKKRFICAYVMSVCLYVYDTHTCCPRNQKRASETLKLWMIVGYHVGAGNQIWALWRTNAFLFLQPEFSFNLRQTFGTHYHLIYVILFDFMFITHPQGHDYS